jgi:hypothetical protein
MAARKKMSAELESMDPVVNEPVVEQPQTSQKSLADKAMPFMMLVLLVMAFGLGTLWNKLQSTKSTQDQGLKVKLSQIKELWGKDLIKFGDANKKLLLVEVGDPSCPFCHVAGGKNPELNKQVGDRFKLVTDGGTYVAPVPEMKKLVVPEMTMFEPAVKSEVRFWKVGVPAA